MMRFVTSCITGRSPQTFAEATLLRAFSVVLADGPTWASRSQSQSGHLCAEAHAQFLGRRPGFPSSSPQTGSCSVTEMMMFFFARPTLSVRTRKQLQSRKVAGYRSLGRCPGFSCGSHTPNRLLGPWDGARGFRADPHPKQLHPFSPGRATGGLFIASFSAFSVPEHLAAPPWPFSWPVQLAAPLRSGGFGPQGPQGLPPSPSSPQGGLLHWPALQLQRLRLRRDQAVYGQPSSATPPKMFLHWPALQPQRLPLLRGPQMRMPQDRSTHTWSLELGLVSQR